MVAMQSLVAAFTFDTVETVKQMVIGTVLIVKETVERSGDPLTLKRIRVDKKHSDKIVKCSAFKEDTQRFIQNSRLLQSQLDRSWS